ncbi:MAG: ABC transporter ATP-binding protein [Clostridiales bacterium]|jgi:ABC-2 type transport system ATP-binding protein|nr:ABC transporter ATP-binding protein [Clostridiales bacterium]
MIEIKNLTKHYGQIRALEDVSFNVDKGDIMGFLGPNGAGKSTAMNIITGYIPYTSGTVLVDGYEILANPREVKRKIGYLPEQPPLYMDMTIREYLSFICDLKSVEYKKRKAQLNDIMYLVKIGDKRDRLIKNLSKGYKQRVGLAQAMIGNPEVLILDEPTVGLDPKQIIEIRRLITALGKEHTIILSSHILSEVSAICNNVVIINNGIIAAQGSADSFSSAADTISKFLISVSGDGDTITDLLRKIPSIQFVELIRTKGEIATLMVEGREGKDVRLDVNEILNKEGIPIMELRPMGNSLEDVFLNVISKDTAQDGGNI